jgi:hypothetical protein
MANPYFRNIPNFAYVNRTSDGRSISDYTNVKNLFRRGRLREDIFQNLAIFEKYQIKGDDRPDNVANEVYGDPTLDWVILLSNNILNVQSEWPLSQEAFNLYLQKKYLANDRLIFNGVHHYESMEIKDSNDILIYPGGLRVGATQSISYYDYYENRQVTLDNISKPVTNYEYEERFNNDKRNIYILKPRYLNVVFDDLEEMMEYKEGSTQYVSETLKRADNIRLFE